MILYWAQCSRATSHKILASSGKDIKFRCPVTNFCRSKNCYSVIRSQLRVRMVSPSIFCLLILATVMGNRGLIMRREPSEPRTAPFLLGCFRARICPIFPADKNHIRYNSHHVISESRAPIIFLKKTRAPIWYIYTSTYQHGIRYARPPCRLCVHEQKNGMRIIRRPFAVRKRRDISSFWSIDMMLL